MTRRDHVQTDRPTHGAGLAAALVAFGAMLMWVAVVFAVLLWVL